MSNIAQLESTVAYAMGHDEGCELIHLAVIEARQLELNNDAVVELDNDAVVELDNNAVAEVAMNAMEEMDASDCTC